MQKNKPTLYYWLLGAHLNLSLKTMLAWVRATNDFQEVHLASAQLSALGFSKNALAKLSEISEEDLEKELLWGDHPDHSLIAYHDHRYPNLLKQLYDPPLLLYVWGKSDILSSLQFSIVGSRHPTRLGVEVAQYFGKSLAGLGFTITSGLARGIDAAAHIGALSAGKTIAVLGSGLKSIYPEEHLALAEKIIEKGAVISEFPMKTGAQPFNFPRRNRLISALSEAVLVVEAAIKSGSLITARLSAEYGKEVFAIPGSLYNPMSAGCHRLIQEGAKLVTSIGDILEEFRQFSERSADLADFPVKKNTPPPLDECHRKLLSSIEYEMTAMDVISARSQLSPEMISPLLLDLELCGYICAAPGGYRRLPK